MEGVVSRCANVDEACVVFFYETLEATWFKYATRDEWSYQFLHAVGSHQTFHFFKRGSMPFSLDKHEPYWALKTMCICENFSFPCCFFKPNLDFLTYTFKHFGAIRYANWPDNDVQPSIHEINMIHVVDRFEDPSSVLKLSQFTALTVLIMTNCMLTDRGIKFFVTLPFPHLQNLILSHNHIGSSGACDLVEMLLSNTTLKMLSLSNNQIGHVGALAMAKLIEHNTALKVLILCQNPLDDHYNSFFQKIKADHRIERQYFSYNVHKNIDVVLTNAIRANYVLDVFRAIPIVALDSNIRAQQRQAMLSAIACAARNGVLLGEDIWLRSFQWLLLLS